jgi:hypothetical protein
MLSAGRLVTVERQRPSFGVWHLSTAARVASPIVADHARELLAALRTAAPGIHQLMKSAEYVVLISIWNVGSFGFDIPSPIVAELAGFCQKMTIRCFDDDGAE